MSRVFVISDLHLGHAGVLKFEPELRRGPTIEDHDQWIVDSWNSVVTKRDTVYVLGDVAWGAKALMTMNQMAGRKILVLGNHDFLDIGRYLMVFDKIERSVFKYKGMWYSHAPIHPAELRGIPNVHGHVHSKSIKDPRYINVCVEALGAVPKERQAITEEYCSNGN